MNASDSWIYETDPGNTARFVLGLQGSNPLIVVTINPSTGSPVHTTPTLGTIRRIAAFYGYDSWIVLGLSAQRATHPQELSQTLNPALAEKNFQVIEQVLSRFPNRRLWAAWGTHYFDRPYFSSCLLRIARIAGSFGDSWMHYGPLDEDGAPRYPLYLEEGEGWSSFSVEAFLEQSLPE